MKGRPLRITPHDDTRPALIACSTSATTLEVGAGRHQNGRIRRWRRRGVRPELRRACIPIVNYDLDCSDIPDRNLRVVGKDIHGFDGDGDGIACET